MECRVGSGQFSESVVPQKLEQKFNNEVEGINKHATEMKRKVLKII